MTEVDLFISTQRIKVLTADTQVCSIKCSENKFELFEPSVFYLFCHFTQAFNKDKYSLGALSALNQKMQVDYYKTCNLIPNLPSVQFRY